MTAPVVVRPSEFDDGTPAWQTVVGEGSREIDTERMKASAMKTAELEAVENARPGVVVLDRNGNFQRFEENPDYWRRYESIDPVLT